MRPHRLRVQAFGAFAGTEQVSFDDLDGLFLLHGETGAGKTTLLDAIAFALYGRVPGERGNARRLRSDHAAPGLATEVELEMTIGTRRLRITRKPEQERPKKSGTGATREQASVRLDELSASGAWESKSTRVVEADQEIRDLMGMSADQFFQVVLLPQGQFAKFLHADAKDKEALLRKLFSTDRFRAVEDWLADRRLSTEKEAIAASDAVHLLLAQVAQAAGVPVADAALVPDVAAGPAATAGAAGPPVIAAGPGPVASSDPWQAAWVAGLAAQAAAAREDAAVLAAERGRDLERALAAKSEAEELAGRQRRRRDALRRQRELGDAAPAIAALRAEAGAALRAAEVKADLDAADRAATAAAAARQAEARARARITDLPAAGPAALSSDAAPEALRAAAEEQRTRLGRLDALRVVESHATEEDEAAASARSLVERLETARAEAQAQIQRQQAARPLAEAARDTASQAATALPGAQDAAGAARRIADDSAALAREIKTWDRLREEHRKALSNALSQRTQADKVHQDRIDGMSAELAANLFDGHECPVCGATEHPSPKEPTFELVSHDKEAEANALAAATAQVADKAGQQAAAAEAVVGDLVRRLTAAGFAPVVSGAVPDAVVLAMAIHEAGDNARMLEAEAARLTIEAADLARLQRGIEDVDANIAAARVRLSELSEQRAAAEAEVEAAAKRAADHRAEVSAQLGGALALEDAITAALHIAEALAAASEAADETVRTAAEASQATDRAGQAAVQAGFAARADPASASSDTAPGENASRESAVAAARAAFREPGRRDEAAGRVSQHETETAAVAAQLAQPDLAVELDPPAPVTETAEAAAAARRAQDSATGAHATAKHTAEQLALLQPRITGALSALAPLRERAGQIRQIADLANGNGANQYRMTLSSFVLAARLEEVAAAASERLVTMTAGRFSLAHSDARKGNAKAGLSLLACDSWTGIDRDTATLSGGETFLASLALALGLADVVTAEAAGTPMEALFVDEGFGTLDEDTLDEVMNVLDGLREGGRIVGIVSHVTELRQRIPSRIHVAKGRHGSHVTTSAG